LSNYIDVYVKDAIKRVPGVATRLFWGAQVRHAVVARSREDGAAGLDRHDGAECDSRAKRLVAAGQIGQQPASNGQIFQFSVRAVAG